MASSENYPAIVSNYQLVVLKDSLQIVNLRSIIICADSTITKLKTVNFEAANTIDKQNKQLKYYKWYKYVLVIETGLLIIKLL